MYKILTLWSILYVPFFTVQASEINYYPLTAIPDNTVWTGDLYTFTTKWEGHAAADYTLTADPVPTGQIGLIPVGGANPGFFQFYYQPAPQDKTPFWVTLAADDGTGRVKSTFQLVPLVNLKNDLKCFAAQSHTNSSLYSVDDIEVRYTQSAVAQSMNYANRQPWTLKIIGTIIEIGGANDYRDLYNTYLGGASGRLDIGVVEITAEKVIVNAPIIVRQANVTINTRELHFVGAEARIETTPTEITVSPGTSVIADASHPDGQRTKGNNGAHGLNAGTITLNVGAIQTTHGGAKLVTRGGNGQMAGPGAHGTDGSIMASWSSEPVSVSGGPSETYTPSGNLADYRMVFTEFWNTFVVSIWIRNVGAKAWPTDGTWAQEPGQPGNGGNAGAVVSSVNVSGLSNTYRGSAGTASTPDAWPYDRWKGGNAGSPEKAVWLRVDYNLLDIWFNPYDSHVAKAGTNFAFKYGTQGASTTPQTTGLPYQWIQPAVITKLIHTAKSLYLDGQIAPAKTRLETIYGDLKTIMASPEWALCGNTDQIELLKLENQVRTQLYQIANHLDYFGKPAGWAPMLSFEANLNLYNREIDHAINTLFLTYWIQKQNATVTQKHNAIAELKAHLQTEIDQDVETINSLNDKMTAYLSQATQIQTGIYTLINQVEAKENELASQANNALRMPTWKMVLKSIAVASKAVPIAEPELSGVLNIVTDFDTQEPYDNIHGITSYVDVLITDRLDMMSKAVGIAASAASGSVGDAAKGTAEAIIDEVKPNFTAGLEGLKDLTESINAPASEIAAEVARMKAENPEFQVLTDSLEELLERKTQFIRDLSDTFTQIGLLNDRIVENLMSMDALNQSIATQAAYDPRVVMHLKELERRTFDRLLKYHYYVAKAYEYRLLTPYPATLNLQPMFDYLKNNATLGSGDEIIPPQHFDKLKEIYQNSISDITATIFEMYNEEGSEFKPDETSKVRFTLTQAELDRLNQGDSVKMNLYEMLKLKDIIRSNEENIRILSIAIQQNTTTGGYHITTAPVGGAIEPDAYVVLNIVHGGESKFLWNGQAYLFRHFAQKNSDAIHWESKYYPTDEEVIPTVLSTSNSSLLKTLMAGYSNEDMMLFSRPALWGDVDLSLAVHANGGKDIDLTYLRLEVTYDFKRRDNLSNLKEVHVLTAAAGQVGTLTPYYAVGRPDRYGKQDGRGAFQRFYQESGINPVLLTAQAVCGDWKFYKWTDRYGNDLPGGPATGRTVAVYPNDNKMILAQYIPAGILPGDLNRDCTVDLADLKLLTGSWLWHHAFVELDDPTDNWIDFNDAAVIFANWQATCQDNMGPLSSPTTLPAPMAAPVIAMPDERQFEVIHEQSYEQTLTNEIFRKMAKKSQQSGGCYGVPVWFRHCRVGKSRRISNLPDSIFKNETDRPNGRWNIAPMISLIPSNSIANRMGSAIIDYIIASYA